MRAGKVGVRRHPRARERIGAMSTTPPGWYDDGHGAEKKGGGDDDDGEKPRVPWGEGRWAEPVVDEGGAVSR